LTHGPARSSLTIMVLFQETVNFETLNAHFTYDDMNRNRKFHVKLFCRTIIYLQKNWFDKNKYTDAYLRK